MANTLYTKGKEKILSKLVSFVDDTIKAVIVSSAYMANLTTHEFLSDVSAARLGADQTLTGKTIVSGMFDAADVSWTAVAAGATAKAVVLYKDTGVEGTSPLLLYIDLITGWPLSTSGGDITVQWDNGAYKIFSL
jgi:hypothetical protein